MPVMKSAPEPITVQSQSNHNIVLRKKDGSVVVIGCKHDLERSKEERFKNLIASPIQSLDPNDLDAGSRKLFDAELAAGTLFKRG